MISLAIRLDYAMTIAHEPAVAHRVAECVTRLHELRRVCARRVDRWILRARATASTVEAYLGDANNDSIVFVRQRAGQVVASGQIECGAHLNVKSPPAVRYMTCFALPFVSDELRDVLHVVFDIATAVRATTGFITLEPTYGLAHKAALGYSIPKPRPGLSETRMRERRVRDYKNRQIHTRLSGLEWGTFLGAGHAIDRESLARSGAFERVVEVSPEITFLQLTADPTDDLSSAIEERIERARSTVRELLLDTSDLPAPPIEV